MPPVERQMTPRRDFSRSRPRTGVRLGSRDAAAGNSTASQRPLPSHSGHWGLGATQTSAKYGPKNSGKSRLQWPLCSGAGGGGSHFGREAASRDGAWWGFRADQILESERWSVRKTRIQRAFPKELRNNSLKTEQQAPLPPGTGGAQCSPPVRFSFGFSRSAGQLHYRAE